MQEGSEALKQFANIKVLGVGGGGGNAVNRMIARVEGRIFNINTDIQAMNVSLADQNYKLDQNNQRTSGGAMPSVGEQSAKESKEDLEVALKAQTWFL